MQESDIKMAATEDYKHHLNTCLTHPDTQCLAESVLIQPNPILGLLNNDMILLSSHIS